MRPLEWSIYKRGAVEMKVEEETFHYLSLKNEAIVLRASGNLGF